MGKRLYLLEFIVIFLLGPLVIALGLFSQEMIFPILWLVFAYTLIVLMDKGVPFFYFKVNRRELMIVLKRFLFLFPLIALFSLAVYPDRLFDFARRETVLWAVVIVLYPLISVVVQEVVFRHFFYYRYRHLFRNRKLFILANAAVFSYAHIVFLNPVSVLFTFLGGIIFAHTYLRSRSLLLVCIEHSLYGDMLFTIGLGSFFYHQPF